MFSLSRVSFLGQEDVDKINSMLIVTLQHKVIQLTISLSLIYETSLKCLLMQYILLIVEFLSGFKVCLSCRYVSFKRHVSNSTIILSFILQHDSQQPVYFSELFYLLCDLIKTNSSLVKFKIL